MNSILSDALGVEFVPRHFSDVQLNLNATIDFQDENSEFDLPIDLYLDENEVLIPEIIQMLKM